MNDPEVPHRPHPALGRASPRLALVLLGVGLLLLVVAPPTPGGSPVVTGAHFAASIPPWNNWTCNPNNPSPTALSVPVKDPGQPELAGSRFNVTYEFKVANFTRTDKGAQLHLPSVKAVLPLTAPGTSLSFNLPGKTVSISGKNWSAPSLLTGSTLLSTNVTFAAKGTAYLTSSKEAVMIDRPSGSITLEFRWQWTFWPAHGGAARVGQWSVPSRSAASPYLPSIFYPAPLVGLTSSSSSPAASGSEFNLSLNGSVAWTSFRVVLEYPNNGTEIQSIWENSTAVTTFNVSVPLSYRSGGGLPAGSYLIHVHDICEAIVHMQSVVVSGSGSGWVPGPMLTVARPT